MRQVSKLNLIKRWRKMNIYFILESCFITMVPGGSGQRIVEGFWEVIAKQIVEWLITVVKIKKNCIFFHSIKRNSKSNSSSHREQHAENKTTIKPSVWPLDSFLCSWKHLLRPLKSWKHLKGPLRVKTFVSWDNYNCCLEL